MLWARAGFVHVDPAWLCQVLLSPEPGSEPLPCPWHRSQAFRSPTSVQEHKAWDFQNPHIINCLEFKNKSTCWEVYA